MTQEQFHLLAQLVQAGVAKVSGDANAALEALSKIIEKPADDAEAKAD